MEGRHCTFEVLLQDFKENLEGAKYISIDTEFTGKDEGGFEDSVEDRLSLMCDVVEKCTLTQIGITIARDVDNNRKISFSTYSVLCFPEELRVPSRVTPLHEESRSGPECLDR